MTTTTERMLPLYEGKMVHQFDHRRATFDGDQLRATTPEEHQAADFSPTPRYWVDPAEIPADAKASYLVSFRDIARPTDERTAIGTVIPWTAVGNKLPIIRSTAVDRWFIIVVQSSYVFDYVARQKVGSTSMNFFIAYQLPVLSPAMLSDPARWSGVSLRSWVADRSSELFFVANDLLPLASESGFGDAPFIWDSARREIIRAELDAAFFHLYGIVRDDVDYIMDTFPIVKRKDEAEFGEYRTKRLILENYDAMQRAIDTGTEFVSTLTPPPGSGPRHPGQSGDD